VTSWLLRGLATAAALALMIGALVAYATAERGAREMLASDRAFNAGRLQLAVQHARRAASAYVPGAGHVQLGYERLHAIARGAERARDVELARAAWRAARAAATESRHVWQPRGAELLQADTELARLSGSTRVVGLGASSSGPSTQVVLGLLLGAACVALGLGGSCGSVGLEERGHRARLRWAMLSCLIGVVVWGLALSQA
jgi:hypothetical protein